MGLNENEKLAYLFDYGLAKKFLSSSKTHIPFNDNKKMVGTLRYASINSQLGYELSRRDDLESLGYCIIYMLKGKLPWQGVMAENKMEKHKKVLVSKQNVPISELCKGLPIEVSQYMYYCRNLLFEDKPGYSQLYEWFEKVITRTHYSHGFEFDWKAMRCDLSTRTRKDKNDSNEAECEVPRKSSKLNMARKIEIKNLASKAYIEISGTDNKNLNKKTVLSGELKLLPEEEKIDLMEVDNKGDCFKEPATSCSLALAYRKQSRVKISSQGSQERTTRMSFKYFLTGNSILNYRKDTKEATGEETGYDFRPSDITEGIHTIRGMI